MNHSPLIFRPSSSSARRRAEGFSLVEVAMALGIFAFAIVPVIGLMNVGLNMSKDSIDSNAMSQIFRLTEAQAQVLTTGTGTFTSGTYGGSITSSIASGTCATSGTLYFTNYGEAPTLQTDRVYQAVISGTTTADSAQGLFARQTLVVKVSRANIPNTILSQRVLELTMPPGILSPW